MPLRVLFPYISTHVLFCERTNVSILVSFRFEFSSGFQTLLVLYPLHAFSQVIDSWLGVNHHRVEIGMSQ